MSASDIAQIIAWLLAANYAAAGFIHLRGAQKVRDAFAKWGFPAGFYYAVGALQLVDTVLLALPATRFWGLILSALLMLGVLGTLALHRDFKGMIPGAVFLVLTGVSLYLGAV